MRNSYIVLLVSVLSACGGGGGNDNISLTPSPPSATASISGSVAGTTIIALNSSGNIVATSETAGRSPDVDTDGDGFLDAYSFELDGIPVTEDVRVYLVTGGAIYPVYFDSDNNGVSDSNVFAVASGHTGPLALGFIDINIENGRAIPTNNPIDDSDVANKGSIPVIPQGINEPPTSGLSIAELNSKGKNALASGWILGAKAYFQAAVDQAGSASATDADTAHFMLALTRVAALEFDTLSDGNAQDMGHLGDLLDLFGFANNEVRANWDAMEVPKPLPDSSPTGNQIRNFSYDVVRPELQAAADDLDKVSQGFDTEFTQDGDVSNADYGDALFFSGLLNSLISTIEIQRAYNVDVDIDDIKNNDRTLEEIQAADSSLLGNPDVQNFAEAKESMITALARLKSAIDSISAETDDQADDLITLDESVNDEALDAAEVTSWINEAQASIIDGTPANIATVSINLQSFFNNGVAFDETFLPGLEGGGTNNQFTDPTFGGVILDSDTTMPGIQTVNKD